MTLFDLPDPVDGGAVFSDDRRYRYRLWRELDGAGGAGGTCVFIMLNPSIAAETTPDNTMTRCVGFAEREGCGRLVIVNLFAIVSPKPEVLYQVDDPVGPDNDDYIADAVSTADLVVAAWGAEKITRTRIPIVLDILRAAGASLQCLGRTKGGTPCHPLYLPKNTPLEPWEMP